MLRNAWKKNTSKSHSTYPLITPHAQHERGKVIGRGVNIYIFITYLHRSLYIFQ